MINTKALEADIVVVRNDADRLTATNAKSFRDQVVALVEGGSSRVVIDLSTTQFVDSSGLGALVGILKRIGHRGELVVCGLNKEIEKLFAICRMDQVFHLAGDESAAVERLKNQL